MPRLTRGAAAQTAATLQFIVETETENETQKDTDGIFVWKWT